MSMGILFQFSRMENMGKFASVESTGIFFEWKIGENLHLLNQLVFFGNGKWDRLAFVESIDIFHVT